MVTRERHGMKGRGAKTNTPIRFFTETRAAFDDGWTGDDAVPPPLRTIVTEEQARSIISYNQSPDLPFERSINPYRGCEHGCIYCYARPTHAYLDLSPGLDFESRLFAKPNAAALLRNELAKSGYVCRQIALGTNTDPYQPIERSFGITRQIIEVLWESRHPLSIVTKSSLVERDLDLLAPMARENLVEAYVSITTLDRALTRRMEPRATAPQRRLETVKRLSAAGIPAGVLFAPVIPALNDAEMESILEAASNAGARYAGYVLLRLPHEVKQLFEEWLQVHEPLKAARIMNRVRDMRGGQENDPHFGTRMRGTGIFAQVIRNRFDLACKRHGLTRSARALDTSKFKPPGVPGRQLTLF